MTYDELATFVPTIFLIGTFACTPTWLEPISTDFTVSDSGCQLRYYKQCSDGDVFWFDSCDNIGEVAEKCDPSGPVGSPYCFEDDVYTDFASSGCEEAACKSEILQKMDLNCNDEGCDLGECLGCIFTYEVTEYACPIYSEADGDGPGGGEIAEVCGEVDPLSGVMTIYARKRVGDPKQKFGARPYQVRVSHPDDPQCGPDTNHFVVSNINPTGIGSETLTFTYSSVWVADQVDKRYCVTASTQFGDPGYDAGDPAQESWWWSEKVTLTRKCSN